MVLTFRQHIDLRNTPRPTERQSLRKGDVITWGDGHGSALRIQNLLVRHNILKIKDEQYQTIFRIYDSSKDELTFDNIKEFRKVLSELESENDFDRISFIGDLFADRGRNDLLTILILMELVKRDIPYEIIFSNHDLSLLKMLEGGYLDEDLETDYYPGIDQCASLVNFRATLKAMRTSEDQELRELAENIKDTIKTHIVDKLKLISYTLAPDGKSITFRTHASHNAEDIIEFAKKVGRPIPKDIYDSPFALRKLIDDLNDFFAKQRQSNDFFRSINMGGDWYNFVWTREIAKPDTKFRYGTHNLHGHVGEGNGNPNSNLDTYLGFEEEGYSPEYDGTYVADVSTTFPNLIEEIDEDDVIEQDSELYHTLEARDKLDRQEPELTKLFTQGGELDAFECYRLGFVFIDLVFRGMYTDAELLLHMVPQVDTFQRDETWGYTSLHYALSANEIALAEKLVSLDADIDAAGDNGLTSLALVVQADRNDLIDKLFSKDHPSVRNSVRALDVDNNKKLFAALMARKKFTLAAQLLDELCLQGYVELARELLVPEIRTVDAEGKSLYHYAAQVVGRGAARLFHEVGSYIHLVAADGSTPFSIAMQAGNDARAECFIKNALASGTNILSMRIAGKSVIRTLIDNGCAKALRYLLTSADNLSEPENCIFRKDIHDALTFIQARGLLSIDAFDRFLKDDVDYDRFVLKTIMESYLERVYSCDMVLGTVEYIEALNRTNQKFKEAFQRKEPDRRSKNGYQFKECSTSKAYAQLMQSAQRRVNELMIADQTEATEQAKAFVVLPTTGFWPEADASAAASAAEDTCVAASSSMTDIGNHGLSTS